VPFTSLFQRKKANAAPAAPQVAPQVRDEAEQEEQWKPGAAVLRLSRTIPTLGQQRDADEEEALEDEEEEELEEEEEEEEEEAGNPYARPYDSLDECMRLNLMEREYKAGGYRKKQLMDHLTRDEKFRLLYHRRNWIPDAKEWKKKAWEHYFNNTIEGQTEKQKGKLSPSFYNIPRHIANFATEALSNPVQTTVGMVPVAGPLLKQRQIAKQDRMLVNLLQGIYKVGQDAEFEQEAGQLAEGVNQNIKADWTSAKVNAAVSLLTLPVGISTGGVGSGLVGKAVETGVNTAAKTTAKLAAQTAVTRYQYDENSREAKLNLKARMLALKKLGEPGFEPIRSLEEYWELKNLSRELRERGQIIGPHLPMNVSQEKLLRVIAFQMRLLDNQWKYRTLAGHSNTGKVLKAAKWTWKGAKAFGSFIGSGASKVGAKLKGLFSRKKKDQQPEDEVPLLEDRYNMSDSDMEEDEELAG